MRSTTYRAWRKSDRRQRASGLLQYGSLEGVLEHAGEIGGVVGENLRKVVDWLPQARKLLTIKCDVSLPVKVEELELKSQDKAKLAALFERFEFKTWRRELQEAAESGAAAEPDALPGAMSVRCDGSVRLRDGAHRRAVERVGAAARRRGARGIRCRNHHRRSVPRRARRHVVLASSARARRTSRSGTAIPVRRSSFRSTLVLERLKPWLEDARHRKVGHDMKYGMHVLANYGIALAGTQDDTLLQSYVMESHKSHDLDNLAERHLQLEDDDLRRAHGQGRETHSLRTGGCRFRDPVCGGGRRRDPAAPRRHVEAARPRREALPHLSRHRDSLDAGAVAHGAQRRAARRGPPRGALTRVRLEDARHRGTRARARGAAVQSEFAAADPGDPVRHATSCRSSRKRLPARLRPTKTCWRSSRSIIRCRS